MIKKDIKKEIIEKLKNKEKTPQQLAKEYKIPKNIIESWERLLKEEIEARNKYWYACTPFLNPVSKVHTDDQWKIQWTKLNRYYKKVKTIEKQDRELTIDDIDLIMDFFIHAYHFKDWVAETLPEKKDEIENLYQNNEVLLCCREIANGVKHKNLNKPKIDKNFWVKRTYDYLEAEQNTVKTNFVVTNIVFEVNGDLKKFDILKLPDCIISTLEKYIKEDLVEK